MINSVLLGATLFGLFVLGYKHLQLRQKVRQQQQAIDDLIILFKNLTNLSNVCVEKIQEVSVGSDVAKRELIEFQQAMADFALSVTDFMDKVRDAFANSNKALGISTEDDKLN